MSKLRYIDCPLIRWLVLGAFMLGATGHLRAQDSRMQLILEHRVGKSVQATSPQHVFAKGDYVRFRFRSSFDGYLYVMDQSTSGKYVVLFPAEGTATSNQVIHDQEYLIPAAWGSWFRVDNPPGYERIFFLISPTKLEKGTSPPPVAETPMPPPPAPGDPSADLLPRCDDSVFRARGECVDVNSGPRALPKDDKVPESMPGVAGTSSRDITVINKSKSSVVAPGDTNGTPLIYEFRLAHK